MFIRRGAASVPHIGRRAWFLQRGGCIAGCLRRIVSRGRDIRCVDGRIVRSLRDDRLTRPRGWFRGGFVPTVPRRRGVRRRLRRGSSGGTSGDGRVRATGGGVAARGDERRRRVSERGSGRPGFAPLTGLGCLIVRRRSRSGRGRPLAGRVVVGRGRGVGAAGHRPDRWMTSRAIDRYASAPLDFGAQVVIGSPATLASGKRTVRAMAVS